MDCPIFSIASDEADRAYRLVLDRVTARLSRLSGLRVLAVILTGSLARGEGTMVRHKGTMVSLSDAEFLVIVPGRGEVGKARRAKGEVEETVRGELLADGIACIVEIMLATRRYLDTAPPAIFSYELKSHGKVLLGPPGILDRLPAIGRGDIPRIDGFYMLCNRIVEQLISRRYIAEGWDAAFNYSLTKTYLDIATSLLVLHRSYVPTYAARATALRALSPPQMWKREEWEDLCGMVDRHTRWKLEEPEYLLEPLDSGEMARRWGELAGDVGRVMRWELAALRGEGDPALMEGSLKARAGLGSLGDWARMGYAAVRGGTASDLLRARVLRGRPRHLLYQAASALYLGFAGGEGSGVEEAREAFPLRPRGDSSAESLADEVTGIWRRYFRNR